MSGGSGKPGGKEYGLSAFCGCPADSPVQVQAWQQGFPVAGKDVKIRFSYFMSHNTVPLFISFFRDWIANDVIYCLAVMGASVLASVLYQICAGLPRTFPAFFRL